MIDRQTASRLGITPQAIDDTLYDAFGQRQISTLFTQLNQYHVILETMPEFQKNPAKLQDIYVRSASGGQVPLSAFTHFEQGNAPLSVNHQGQFPTVTISFNLAPGAALGDATKAIEQAQKELNMPLSIQAAFQGTAQSFQASLSNEPLLILAAVVTVYIVLGVLYESYIHAITILSTLPSAGVGAILALLVCGSELSVVALIGIILLIGIVKKNAIMMIDFALDAERREGKSPRGGDLPGLPAPFPAHHDDHDGRAAGRLAPGAGNRDRLGTAPAAGHLHRRRTAHQPVADLVHHARDLPLLRSPGFQSLQSGSRRGQCRARCRPSAL